MSKTDFICYENEEHYESYYGVNKLSAKFKITENDIINGYKIILASNKKIEKKPLSYILKFNEIMMFAFKDGFCVYK